MSNSKFYPNGKNNSEVIKNECMKPIKYKEMDPTNKVVFNNQI